MPTPQAYYDMLPDRLVKLGIGTIEDDQAELRDLEARVHAAVVDLLVPFGVDDSGNTCANAVSHGDASACELEAIVSDLEAVEARMTRLRLGEPRGFRA